MASSNASPLADELGAVKAAIAELEAREQTIRAALVACGFDAVEGALFRVTISKSVRETLDARAARERLEILGTPPQWFASHTKSTPIVTVKCSARTGIARAA